MNVDFSPQIRSLWKIGIITVVWYIWFSRNCCTWEDGTASSLHILKMTKAAFIEASRSFSLGHCSGSWSDYIILRNMGVKCCPAPPKQYISVVWWPPPPDWIKVNTDGSALGAPGILGAGGAFRNSLSAVLGCFHYNGGSGFAFEAELLAVMHAIEIAVRQGWFRLWLETDSMYIAGLLSSRSSKVPWRFFPRWQQTLSYLLLMDIRITHIYREGNAVADIMASAAIPEGWWPHAIPEIYDAVAQDIYSPGSTRAV